LRNKLLLGGYVNLRHWILVLFIPFGLFEVSYSSANTTQSSIERMNADSASGKPLVAHVIVALCDNEYQGIVPVPKAIGNGDDPNNNLYWGAGYGVKTFFRRSPNWKTISLAASDNTKILDQAIFKREINRNGKKVMAYVFAEAWRGREIAAATEQFLKITQGNHQQTVKLDQTEIAVGSNAHLIAYVGHNGLMDFYPPELHKNPDDKLARTAVILACKSYEYFENLIDTPTSLLLTTRSFMAPEAYSLEAAISSWFENSDKEKVAADASKAYAKYQKISEKSARTVFVFPNSLPQTQHE
jgi:hypothetical protein